jgi:exopolyphosphatase/pppGpp-phosphohydrolase
MNFEADADLVRCFATARRHASADAAVTMFHIGARESAVVSGHAGDAPTIVRIPLGCAATGPLSFRHDPPTPLELETAIAVVEDAVMPLARRLPRPSTLVGVGEALRALPPALGTSESAIALADVEQLFQQLAGVAEGRPVASSGLPAGRTFAATLLILREFMHHLGFDSIVIEIGDPASAW